MLLILGSIPQQLVVEVGLLVVVGQQVEVRLLVMLRRLVMLEQQVELLVLLPSWHLQAWQLQVLPLVELLVFRPLPQYNRFLSRSDPNICYHPYPKLYHKQSISANQPSYHL